jgi:hypothetical protein
LEGFVLSELELSDNFGLSFRDDADKLEPVELLLSALYESLLFLG